MIPEVVNYSQMNPLGFSRGLSHSQIKFGVVIPNKAFCSSVLCASAQPPHWALVEGVLYFMNESGFFLLECTCIFNFYIAPSQGRK